VICGAASPEPHACCSVQCVRVAEREISANIGALRRLRTGGASRSERARLTARNGELTSAMLRWRPTVVEPVAETDRVR